MADNFGTGVSRVLDPKKAQLTQVIWQQGKPPLDSELNLMQQLSAYWQQGLALRGTPSGWLGNGINDPEAFVTDATWSNWFRFGQQKTGELGSIQWAVVNGWLIPVTGTLTGTPPGSPNDSATWNKVTLGPPPSNSGDSRIDFVFLEVWQAQLPPNPSTTNKPSASGIYRYGNVEGGYSFLSDDLLDPALAFETTQRVQIQYRVRVVSGLIGLTSFPDGFDPANVKARGAATADTAYTFTNMRKELGDAGLWRAGDGTPNSLGTVDGYSYAIPLAAIFRRNSVAWDGDPGQNLNGGFNRNPTAVDRTGVKTFSTVPTLATSMTSSQLTLTLSSATNVPLPTNPATAVTIRVGDEFMTYSSITGTTMTLVSRGALGSKAEVHPSGVTVLPVPGRPDGYFADQVAKTDILDLRHVVNPNGFNYDSLLKGSLDSLLKGRLRANWKRSGAGPQGSFVAYQDKISASAAALGVTLLDAPDNIRHVFSDVVTTQSVLLIATPPVGTSASENITTDWAMPIEATINNSGGVANTFSPNKVITIPVAQFKNTVPGADSDQVSFVTGSGVQSLTVKLRVAGSATDLVYTTDYTVNAPAGPDDDLIITLSGAFSATTNSLFISFYVQYGPGRGLSRRPDAVHSLAYLNASSGTLLRQQGTPANNIPISVGYAPLWSRIRSTTLQGQIPITAESYVDPGSRTVILNPFRRLALPATSTTFRAIQDNAINGGSGLMPNPASKWGTVTDPLGLFSNYNDSVGTRKNTYMVVPRNLMPGWGAVHTPIIHTDTSTFAEGINFGFHTVKGTITSGDHITFFVPFPSRTWCTFSTIDQTTAGGTNTALAYNTKKDLPHPHAGMRFFTDTRGLGRRGLELPPFYGIARLFAVYDAEDYGVSMSSSYDQYTRDYTGSGATNLLRQDFEGPLFFIEIDDDGDSTFILNADAIDITKSPNSIASFEAGNYAIEANIFGFDRGAFDLSQDCRVVLTQSRSGSGSAVNVSSDASLNTADISLVVPGPPQGADSVAVNYSRTPYQGDAWGSQNTQLDIGRTAGPLTSADANQLGYTELDEESLTRPNQKVFEVLASTGFMTTLGTGRFSGDFDGVALNLMFPGAENASTYPPTSPVGDRPIFLDGSTVDTLVAADMLMPLGSEYHGCTERLPLGSLFRDKDFRGNAINPDAASGASPIGLVFTEPNRGTSASLARPNNPEMQEVPVFTASQAGGGVGDIVVHVDGETSNLTLLTNYRTTRGGSAFTASGNHPGGEVAAHLGMQPAATNWSSTLVGVAYLVRNSVTNIGSTEVSAGQELMLFITTTAVRNNNTTKPLFVLCGTQGSGEGFSAADIYRITGRPLTNDAVRVNLDPSLVEFSGKISYKPVL